MVLLAGDGSLRQIVQKIYPTKEEAIFYGKQAASQHESEVYVQEKNGKFNKLKE